MASILDTLKEFFEEHDWPFVQMEDPSLLQLVYRGKTGSWACFARAREEHSQFIFYSVSPLTVPDTLLHEMAEFLMRVNFSLMLGAFEMDFGDGEVRYKTGISVEGTELNTALIKSVVFSNLAIMDRYLPGLTAVMSGYLTPEEAVKDIEEKSA